MTAYLLSLLAAYVDSVTTFQIGAGIVTWIAFVYIMLSAFHGAKRGEKGAGDDYTGVAARRHIAASPLGRVAARASLRAVGGRGTPRVLTDRFPRADMGLAGEERYAPLSVAEKQRIVDVLNARGLQYDVALLDMAVEYGFASWWELQRDTEGMRAS